MTPFTVKSIYRLIHGVSVVVVDVVFQAFDIIGQVADGLSEHVDKPDVRRDGFPVAMEESRDIGICPSKLIGQHPSRRAPPWRG